MHMGNKKTGPLADLSKLDFNIVISFCKMQQKSTDTTVADEDHLESWSFKLALVRFVTQRRQRNHCKLSEKNLLRR